MAVHLFQCGKVIEFNEYALVGPANISSDSPASMWAEGGALEYITTRWEVSIGAVPVFASSEPNTTTRMQMR